MTSKASAPFDDPRADIILRSSDGVDFKVYKTVLSLASPVFESMLAIPQPSNKAPPSIPFEEDSTTLDRLLRYCYPLGHEPAINNLDDLETVLKVADKYALDAVAHRLESRYIVLGEIKRKPVKAFMLACRYQWGAAARAAARDALFFSLNELLSQSEELNLREFRAADYYKLLQYHLNCCEACQKVCNNFFGQRLGVFWLQSKDCTCHSQYYSFDSTIRAPLNAVRLLSVRLASYSGKQEPSPPTEPNCVSCNTLYSHNTTIKMAKDFEDQLIAATEKVKLDLSFETAKNEENGIDFGDGPSPSHEI